MDPDHRRIYKLFISSQHPTVLRQIGWTPGEDERRSKTFASERDAYTILSQLPALARWAPRFEGIFTVAHITGANGNSISHRYLLDCCYGLEYIPHGPSRKLQAFLGGGHPHLDDAVVRFKAAGIAYLRDASVFLPEDPMAFKIIDFAVREFEPSMIS
jgi:hypothetical protein